MAIAPRPVAAPRGVAPEPSPRLSAMVSSSLAGELNRARVLKALYANGPLPRPELARRTGSTRATIGQIVQPLLDDGLLEEHEPLASGAQGGKPARPIWFSDNGWPVGAVLVLPRGARAAVVTMGGRVLASSSTTFTDDDTRATVVRRLMATVTRTIAKAGVPLHGIGVAVGGMVDTTAGEIVRVGLAPALDGLPVGPMLEEATGVPTFVDLHPRAQALGDLLFGVGRGETSFCSVYIGEGIGCGFIIDGALHRGERGSGGEIGHTLVDRHGPRCWCGLTGCWEEVASRGWLRAAAAARGVVGARGPEISQLAALANRDRAAAELLRDYADNLSLGIANLQQILGIGLFVLHGDPARAGEPFRAAVEAAVRARTLPHPGGLPRLVLGTADDASTLRGAAGIVLSRSLHVAF